MARYPYRVNRASLEKKRHAVAAMFDQVAKRYDLVNDLLSVGQDRQWRRATTAALAPTSGELILDLASGTGTSATPFVAAGAKVIPADISLGMLRVGKNRQPKLPFINADALALPFADNSFDAVTISFGLRNIADTTAALQELRRVTKVGGRIVICEFSTPTWTPFRKIYENYLVKALPKLASITSSNPEAYDYLAESILAWPDQKKLALLLADVGWQQAAWKNLTGGIVCLHRGWK